FIFFKIGSILGNKGNEIAINIKQNNGSNIWNQMVDSFHNFITMVLKDFFGPNTFIGNLVSNSIKFNGFGLIIFLLILMLISIFLALITLPIAKYDTFDLYNDNTLPKIKKYAINHLCLLVL
ncbi:MAG: hypothetical protein LBC17_00580, partial [Lactobacillaceae bacterium]|nr:hypothetical protein [Lactobacillaceae bacterium]